MSSGQPLDFATMKAAQAFRQGVMARYDVADVLLFGSRARNEAHPESDADIAVLLRGKPGAFVATKLDMDDIAYDVLLETGIRIQPLPVWESEWASPERYSNPALLRNIAAEGVRV